MKEIDSKRNWEEDFPHENGNYQCVCCICGNYFIGHKRRVSCKLCNKTKLSKEVVQKFINKDFQIISTEESLEGIEPFFTDEELRQINQNLFVKNEEINKKEINNEL